MRVAGRGRWPGHAAVARQFALQLLAALGGQLVIAGPPVLGGLSPFPGNPALDEHTLQGRVERPFLHLQNVFGGLLDIVRDLEAVHRAGASQGLQNQHVEGAREGSPRAAFEVT